MTSEPALAIRDLHYRYPGRAGSDGWSLDVPELDLAAGEQMLLTGSSGSGKSTLLHLVCGLMEPDAGEIRVGGTILHSLRGAARDRFRGRSVGMIFQSLNLLHGFSALENVMAALMFSEIPRGEHRERSRELLSQLGIDQPNREPHQMSVGQQQRIAVARAIACDPVLVLADEPTASLDPANSAQAMELIQSSCAARGAALLCVSHDPSHAARFDRMADLEAEPATPAASSEGS